MEEKKLTRIASVAASEPAEAQSENPSNWNCRVENLSKGKSSWNCLEGQSREGGKVVLPDSPGFNGFVAAAIAESKITLLKSSGFDTTPNAWNDIPSFSEVIVTSSPEFTVIVGLLPSSPGNALNAKVLKSSDSTKSSVNS